MKHDAEAMLTALPAEIQVRLEIFCALLSRWNQRINLVSRGDLADLRIRHLADSAQLAPLVEPGVPLVDLGSGAGFPGLVIAICTGNPVTLVEADTRKASFLREAARATGTVVSIVDQRIEQLSLPPVSLVTARALAPLSQLLDWAAPLLTEDGRCLFLKGRMAEDELTAAATRWHMAVTRIPSRTRPDGVILSLSRLRRLEEQTGRP